MGLSILFAVVFVLLMILGLWRSTDSSYWSGEWLSLTYISGFALLGLIIIAPIVHGETKQVTRELDALVMELKLEEKLIADFEKTNFSDNEINLQDKDKLKTYAQLKRDRVDTILAIRDKLNYAYHRIDNRFVYILPFKAEDFKPYEEFLKGSTDD